MSEFRQRVKEVIDLLPPQYFYPVKTICKVLKFKNVSYVRYFVLPKLGNCMLLRFNQRILVARKDAWYDIVSSSTYFRKETKFWVFDIERYCRLLEDVEEVRRWLRIEGD